MFRFYIRVYEDGYQVIAGWCLRSLTAEHLRELHGAVVQEHIRRENAMAKAAKHESQKSLG